MLDITQYIGIDLDELIEELRGLHEERATLTAICDDELKAKNLASLRDTITTEIMTSNHSMAFNKAQAMAMADQRYKDKLDYYADKVAKFALINQQYWLITKQFDKGMKLIDFAKQETYIMNRGKRC